MLPTPEFFENIAKLSCAHFNIELPKTGKPIPEKKEWTTLAAIVKSCETETSTSNEVVAIATGTKCLGQAELSSNGDLLSDSHAEVLCRRAFIVYLYDQINLYLKPIEKRHKSDGEPIFELIKDIEGNDEKPQVPKFRFRLTPNHKFHLFVSHVPCGDASIFSKQVCLKDVEADLADEPERKKSKLDIEFNRTGAKLLSEEKVFEEVQEVGKCRVKPGKGDPTLCMSCSDKIAKWQLLGLQGSLLGNFIPEPIRFASIVIGSGVPFNKEAVERAIYRRFYSKIKDNDKYAHPLTTNAIEVYQCERTNFMDLEGQVNPAPASIIWMLTQDLRFQKVCVQVSVNGRKQGVTKKNQGKPGSRLEICRKNLFSKFLDLSSKSNVDVSNFNYKRAKGLNVAYSETWEWLKKNVTTGWTEKPNILLDFDQT